MIEEVEPSSVEEDPSAAQTPVRHDFSVVRGFQVVAAEDHAAAQKQGGDEAWRDALKANWRRAPRVFIKPWTPPLSFQTME